VRPGVRSGDSMTRAAEARDGLTPCQRQALEFVRAAAVRRSAAAREAVRAALGRAGASVARYDEVVTRLRRHARIALHFHPERLAAGGGSVAEGLLESGAYQNQFVTGLSSGSPSAFAGGERDGWEECLFGGSYHGADAPPASRPKYGALVVAPHPDGPAPRFGSCYFVLRPEVADRATFTWGGSHEDGAAERTATLDTLEVVLAPLLRQLEAGQGAFAIDDLDAAALLEHLGRAPSLPRGDLAHLPLGRALDSFVEVQVHGEVRLAGDVERLVADPAFRDHPVGGLLAAIAARAGVELSWHPGFTLAVREVPEVFRDYPVRPLAERAAPAGLLDAAIVGAAANTLEFEPQSWSGWASRDDILTQFRRLWHVLVLQGAPRTAAPL